MFGSAVLYGGLVVVIAGLAFIIRPRPRLGMARRTRGVAVAVAGVFVGGMGLTLPASEATVAAAETQLDHFMPVWQFRELHTARIAAPPDRVFAAIRAVHADEILFLRTLAWIRRGGFESPEMVEAARRESMLEFALHNGFISLASDPPKEIVVGTVIIRPRDVRRPLTPEMFQEDLPPNFALATMNFLVTADGTGGSNVSTETRVFANSERAAALCRLLAADLSRQRAHSTDVAARDRQARDVRAMTAHSSMLSAMLKKSLLLVVVLTGVLALFGYVTYLGNMAPAVRALSAEEAAKTGKPYVVKLHAQWCPVCMWTKGVWSQIEETYAGRVNLVVLDFTNEANTAASRAEAARLGLGKFYDEYAGATGTIVVLDGRTREVTASINGSRDFAEYRRAVDATLKDAASRQ